MAKLALSMGDRSASTSSNARLMARSILLKPAIHADLSSPLAHAALSPIALTAPHDRVGIALVPFVGPSSPAASTSGHAPDKIACSSIPLPCLPGRLA